MPQNDSAASLFAAHSALGIYPMSAFVLATLSFSGLALGAPPGGSVTSGWGLSVSCPKMNWCTGHPVFCGPTLVTCQGPYIVWRPFWSTFEALHPKQVAEDEASMIKFRLPAHADRISSCLFCVMLDPVANQKCQSGF